MKTVKKRPPRISYAVEPLATDTGGPDAPTFPIVVRIPGAWLLMVDRLTGWLLVVAFLGVVLFMAMLAVPQ